MASELVDNSPMATTDTSQPDDVVSIDLAAPPGSSKKFIPKKSGTPRRNEIVFIAPTGEEIKTKRQLDQYLKSHPGGLSASEFDWGTGDTPRRSSRLSSKPKPTETPKSESSRKRQKRSNSKEEQKKEETDGEGGSAEDEASAGENESKPEAEKDADKPEAEKDADKTKAGNDADKPEAGKDADKPEAGKDDNKPEAEKDADKTESEKNADKTEAEKDVEMKDAEISADEVQIDSKPATDSVDNGDANLVEASVDNGKGKADETKQQEADSSVLSFANGKEVLLEEKRSEGEPEQTAAQVPQETNNPSEVSLHESVSAGQDQPAGSEEKPADELSGTQVQMEAAPVDKLQCVDEVSTAYTGTGVDFSMLRQKDLDQINSEEVKLDGDDAEGNQEAANQVDNKPANAGNAPPEPSAAPLITC